MFDTIVLALDGSDEARNAIPVATELAEKEEAKLVIAHVLQYPAAKGGEVPPPGQDEIRAEIKQQAEDLSTRGIPVEVEFADAVLGGPAHAIVDIADRTGRRPHRDRHSRTHVACRRAARQRDPPPLAYREAPGPSRARLGREEALEAAGLSE